MQISNKEECSLGYYQQPGILFIFDNLYNKHKCKMIEVIEIKCELTLERKVLKITCI